MKIELVSFENDLANFEIRNNGEMVSCHAHIGINSLHDFLDGEFVIFPDSWFDSEEDCIDRPEWFKRKELNLLNDAFEIGYKNICEKMIDNEGGL